MDTPQAQAKSEKVQLVTRIGAITWDTTKDGGAKVTFRLAEHPNAQDQDETVWHKVVATRTLAQKLQELNPPLQTGEQLEIVTGYPYSWSFTDKDGQPKVNKGINPWVVKVRGQTYRQTRKQKEERKKQAKATEKK